jgi:hypothetical protein
LKKKPPGADVIRQELHGGNEADQPNLRTASFSGFVEEKVYE